MNTQDLDVSGRGERCQVTLELVATAGVDPDELTRFVGLPPTRLSPGKSGATVWELVREGPSPVNAGRVANDLARELLADLGAAGRGAEAWRERSGAFETAVRFDFHFPRLFNFSYELDPAVVAGLAGLEAFVSFDHQEDWGGRDRPVRYGSGRPPYVGCELTLRLAGDGLDPDVVTTTLGATPGFKARRAIGGAASGRVWLLEGHRATTEFADEAIVGFLDAIPTRSEAWRSLARDYTAHLLLCFKIPQLTGYFDLDAATVRRVADAGCGLDAAFYDWSPGNFGPSPPG